MRNMFCYKKIILVLRYAFSLGQIFLYKKQETTLGETKSSCFEKNFLIFSWFKNIFLKSRKYFFLNFEAFAVKLMVLNHSVTNLLVYFSLGTGNTRKRPRSTFSFVQVRRLEMEFIRKVYLSSAEKTRLANELRLTRSQVKTWFQNRRMKLKHQIKDAAETGGDWSA